MSQTPPAMPLFLLLLPCHFDPDIEVNSFHRRASPLIIPRFIPPIVIAQNAPARTKYQSSS